MKKIRILSTMIAVLLIMVLSTSGAFAAERSNSIIDNIAPGYSIIEPKDGGFNGYYYTKKNPVISYEWSAGKRVSDDLETDAEGGQIHSDRVVSFSGSSSGETKGLTFSGALTISSEIGYTLNVGGNQKKYMAYKVCYIVEKGIREKRAMMTGKVVSTNSYTVKRIDHGSYYLVTANY